MASGNLKAPKHPTYQPIPATLETLISGRASSGSHPRSRYSSFCVMRMGKNRRVKPQAHNNKKHKLSALTRPSGIIKSKDKATKSPTNKHRQAHRISPTIPFSSAEHLLLIGEGDLSFARSLICEHKCTNVTATVFETEPAIREKYPQVEDNIRAVEEGGGRLRYGIDATKLRTWTQAGKEVGKGVGGVDRIIFNFPHVGGKTKDVNRQVRYNQELLVSFFQRAVPSLSPTRGSSIIVTLFEGEPYTLWNIRDLARHSGLEVEKSFKFQASVYPGYRHARTLGVVKGDGGWKGEERASRTYVFVRKGEGVKMGQARTKQGAVNDDENDNDETSGNDSRFDRDQNHTSTGIDDERFDEDDNNSYDDAVD